MLTIKQICEKHPYVSQSLVYLWVEQKELPHYRLGGRDKEGRAKRGRILIEEQDFLAVVASKKVGAVAAQPVRRFRHLS